jgi:hypothetical protein
VSLAGFYYFAVQQNANEGHRYDDPLQITIDVTGERRGVPAYRGTDPAESSVAAGQGRAAAPADRLGRVAAVVATGAGLALVATGLVAAYLIRIRRRHRPDAHPGAWRT